MMLISAHIVLIGKLKIPFSVLAEAELFSRDCLSHI